MSKANTDLMSGLDLSEIRSVLKKDTAPSPENGGMQVLSLALDAVEPDPNQPRRQMEASGDGQRLEDLAESILEHGILNPITVEKVGENRYRIVSGERRYRAATIARDSGKPCARAGYDLTKIPAIVIQTQGGQNRLEMQLVENIAREDMSDDDIAEALHILMDTCGMSKADVARRLGRDRAWVSRILSRTNPEAKALAARLGISLPDIGAFELNKLLSWQGGDKDGWLDDLAEAIRDGTPFSRTLMTEIENRHLHPDPVSRDPVSRDPDSDKPGAPDGDTGEVVSDEVVSDEAVSGDSATPSHSAAETVSEPVEDAGRDAMPLAAGQAPAAAQSCPAQPLAAAQPPTEPDTTEVGEEEQDEESDGAGHLDEERSRNRPDGVQEAPVVGDADTRTITLTVPYALAAAIVAQVDGEGGEVTAERLLDALQRMASVQ
ncbi:ParB/RepB/Spo0J family partition protein [Acidithiobacillus caldus]|uniref:Chromosome (Plasmid) partitioning protein ParB / Stage 0 sporulation protein J n=1 Tax=Acidithiobacillus caldus (strain ATCC 51756 / DSM 8584 / KU) TaxID=637389 RepID=A0A060A0B8_ACICK|nr:ParB/RepB/Spo0J family partition protein [Acidithiobacillus caldus]AIA55686.1 Chromosome (plasmid) partitioning protein ParB / Stage 0 sporulation protein J [Acidithiobacillus caldus ATCC 51756]MBU2729719.1 ParB/RepB/Spo0J family partition protein [Acidithiobacillus caldus]MBU2736088.1 ParB/RepB/Spo0J family partition protein [Acidithiobacillus caldus ATCC 51756]MBU2743865.1 ParB/RepB/Spo0J family partition protein [Acidithiobacillus caldus]MBU2781568.1 ParB/RepB/Spo0J family partition prot